MSIRFAPSPTGRFHLGNLRTALVSHEIARRLRLSWELRFEDIDRPRVVLGADQQQLADLKDLGLVPDRIYYQSTHHALHHQAFLKLRALNAVYACFCSRKDNELSAPHAPAGTYSGACRNLRSLPPAQALVGKTSVAWRLKKNDLVMARSPMILSLSQDPTEVEFQPSYHFACAIDDELEGHQIIVRGQDLASARLDQKSIYQSERYRPAFVHTRMVVGRHNERLEKRSVGVTLDELVAGGHTPQSIKNKLKGSIDEGFLGSVSIDSDAVFDEPGGPITVHDLGF